MREGLVEWTETDLWVKTRMVCEHGHEWTDVAAEAAEAGCPTCGSRDVRPADA